MPERKVLRYRLRSRVFHWLHSLTFVVLLLTGLARLLHNNPAAGFHMVSIIHRSAAGLFVGLPLLYYLLWPKQVGDFVRGLFRWHKEDLQWLRAAPLYYFGGPEDKMPPQDEIDPGQRAWEVAIVVTGVIFVLTGVPLWFFKWVLPLEVYQWALTVHAVAFIIVFIFFLLHIYLGVFHPRFKESLRSMLDGRVSAVYARMHYRKWFEKEKKK
jgi:formate dehydrogenase subunit gamma